MNVINGNMLLISEYLDMIKDINNNIVPKKWKLYKFNKNSDKYKDMDSWLSQIKHIYDIFNKWIFDGFLNVYDLSIFNDEKLFITLLPIYFQKKLPESQACSSDKIILNFKLTKYDSNEEITEEIINDYKKANNNQEFIFIKGLRLKGFEGIKEEDREIKTFKENLNNQYGDLLPIVAVSYRIKKYQVDLVKIKKEEESEEEDEDEEILMNQEESNEKMEEKPQPSGGGGPKDEGEEEDKKDKEVEEKKVIEGIQLESKKVVAVQVEQQITKAKKEVTIIQKTKIRNYKKYCRLDIPFIEERDENVYNVNEPYGYLEIRFFCDKYKQEEYFINRNIFIVLDK